MFNYLGPRRSAAAVVEGNDVMVDGETVYKADSQTAALVMWCLAHYVFNLSFANGKKTRWSSGGPWGWSVLPGSQSMCRN